MKVNKIDFSINFKKNSNQDEFRQNSFEYENPHDAWIDRIINNAEPEYVHYQGKLEEYKLKETLAALKKPAKVYEPKLSNLEIYNFSEVCKGAYRGQTLADRPECIEKFQKAGICQIIDLHCYKKYENACAEKGIDYFPFMVGDDFYEAPVFLTKAEYLNRQLETFRRNGYEINFSKEEISEFAKNQNTQSKNFIKNFIKFIEKINKGNFYISCSYGIIDTNKALMLNQFFNPQNKTEEHFSPSKREIKIMGELYKKLTKKDKEALGWDNNFEEGLRAKLHIKK